MNTAPETVRLIPLGDHLDFIRAVERMRQNQQEWLRLRGEMPHMNLEPLYKVVRRLEADVDRRVREAIHPTPQRPALTLFAEGGGS